MSQKILDVVKPGVVTGDDVQKIFSICKENKFALPAVNVISTDTINAVLEAAEFGDVYAVDARGETYADAVLLLARHDGAEARRLLAHHATLCQRRRALCSPECFDFAEHLRNSLWRQSKRWPSTRVPATALEAWLQECGPLTSSRSVDERDGVYD